MNHTAQEIADHISGELRGDGSRLIQSVASLRNATSCDLTYAEEKLHAEAAASRAGCVIVGAGEFPGKTVIVVRHPKLAFAKAAAWLLETPPSPSGVHPTAVVAADVTLGTDVRIGAGAVIESGVAIDAGSTIEAGCYLGANVAIGKGCTLYPRVVVYRDVRIGDRVIVHAGAVIGSDGFGYVKDGAVNFKFPQTGRVVIEDDVEIGANTCIDRGSLETTIIRKNAKLDNLIQVAHNVEIGEHTLIAAQTGISGSSSIGAQSMIGGQVGIGEHARLDDGTIIGGQGGVLNGKHIRGGEVLWGTPVRPLREFLVQEAHLAKLPKLAARIEKLLRRKDLS